MPIRFEETTKGLQIVVNTTDSLVISLQRKLGDVLIDSRSDTDLADRMDQLLQEAIVEMESLREDLKDPTIVLDNYEMHPCDICPNGVTQGRAKAADHCPHCPQESLQMSYVPPAYRIRSGTIRKEDPAYDIY
jgi:hypothetical protein